MLRSKLIKMAAALLSSAVFAALLLLLSLTGAGADGVTWHKCKQAGDDRGRVLEALPDTNASLMSLEHCNLTEVRSGDFDGLPNVDIISLSFNAIVHVDTAAFRTVPKLKSLHLSKNDLREVPVFDEHSFCPCLTVLLLSYNRITEINHPKTFSGCTELQYIDIEHNVIEYIHPDVFRSLSKLKSLYISNNKITAIPETLFMKKTELDVLHLTKNKISYLPSDFVSKLRSAVAPLGVFHFHDNPWHCVCLLEVPADVKRAGEVDVSGEHWPPYTGRRPVCVYDGPYPCCRPARSGLLSRAKQ